jgi:hypothetical protein
VNWLGWADTFAGPKSWTRNRRRADSSSAEVMYRQQPLSTNHAKRAEAFDAWLHSKTPQVIERTTADDDKTSKTVESRTHQCDASLLGQVRGALADIRAIWGLDSPTKTEVSGTVKGYHVANTPESL